MCLRELGEVRGALGTIRVGKRGVRVQLPGIEYGLRGMGDALLGGAFAVWPRERVVDHVGGVAVVAIESAATSRLVTLLNPLLTAPICPEWSMMAIVLCP